METRILFTEDDSSICYFYRNIIYQYSLSTCRRDSLIIGADCYIDDFSLDKSGRSLAITSSYGLFLIDVKLKSIRASFKTEDIKGEKKVYNYSPYLICIGENPDSTLSIYTFIVEDSVIKTISAWSTDLNKIEIDFNTGSFFYKEKDSIYRLIKFNFEDLFLSTDEEVVNSSFAPENTLIDGSYKRRIDCVLSSENLTTLVFGTYGSLTVIDNIPTLSYSLPLINYSIEGNLSNINNALLNESDGKIYVNYTDGDVNIFGLNSIISLRLPESSYDESQYQVEKINNEFFLIKSNHKDLAIIGLSDSYYFQSDDFIFRQMLPDNKVILLDKDTNGVLYDLVKRKEISRLGEINSWYYPTNEEHVVATLLLSFGGKNSQYGSLLELLNDLITQEIYFMDTDNGLQYLVTSIECDKIMSFTSPLIFTKDGKLLMTGCRHLVKIWDRENYQVINTIESPFRQAISCIAINEKNSMIACGDWGGNIFIMDTYTQNILRNFSGHSSVIRSIDFGSNNTLVSSSEDGAIVIWDLFKSEELATISVDDDDNFIIYTPDYYYYSNKYGLRNVNFIQGEDIFSFDQFDLKYNRPDIVLERIGYASSDLVDTYHKAYEKRIEKKGFTKDMLKADFHVPEIEIMNFDEAELLSASNLFEFKVRAWDDKYKLDRLNVWINEVPIYGMAGIDLSDLKTDSIVKTIEVELSNGNNKIQVSVLNQAGAESLKETIKKKYTGYPLSPDLYIVAIGVSDYMDTAMNLDYAVKDGRDIIRLFSSRKDLYDQIHIDTLFDLAVTKENIMQLKEELMKSRVDDHVILFLSGHGLLDAEQDFYYATHNMDFTDPARYGILYDDIEGLLDGIPARNKLLFIDACHSGEVDKEAPIQPANNEQYADASTKGSIKTYTFRGNKNEEGIGLQYSFELMQELFTNLNRGSGAVVISAAAGNGYALEDEQWDNGAFTYTILNGLKYNQEEMDQDINGEISVNELKDYVLTNVEKITNGAQKPTTRRENLEVDWRVW